MDSEIQQLVSQTGICLPLTARVMGLLAESGASQLEMTIVLDLVNHLRHMIPAAIVPEDHPAAPTFEAMDS